MIQPARVVVPSNAPLLPEGRHASEVLQEHSDNREIHSYSYAHGVEQKCTGALSAENASTGFQPRQSAQHAHSQTPLQRHHHLRCGHARWPHDHLEEQARREKQAMFLYTRFCSSDLYMKYRNRQHTRKEQKAGQASVWPDCMELAFFRALVQWPPMGRRQLPHKGKLRGRNELLADHIEELTGELRTRKQVMSHIQVLKPFVRHDIQIMRWLSLSDMGAESSRHYSGRCASLHDTRRSSLYAMQPPTEQARSPVPPTSRIDCYYLSQHIESLKIFEPNDFQMFVQRKYGEDQAERLHTYTSSIQKPRQSDMQLHACLLPEERESHKCCSLDMDFPLLAAMHKRRPLDCNVLVAEASLALDVNSFKDEAGNGLPGVELGISFLCKSHYLPADAVVRCQNTFFKDGSLLREHSSTSPVAFTRSEDGTGVETQVKFGSTFWARTLAFLAGKLRSVTTPSRNPRQEVIDYLHSITACQEIAVSTEAGWRRVLIIYWKFRLSTSIQGRAYWTRVLLPTAEGNSARVDSVFDPDPDPQTHVEPTLQSPFKYDNSAATWQASLDEASATAPQSAIEMDGDNAFDFNGGNINISYDPTLDFNNFDSSAFDLAAAAELAADPALQEYTQTQDYSQAENYMQSTQAYTQALQSGDYTQPSYCQHASQAIFSQDASQPVYSQETDYSAPWDDHFSFDGQQSVREASTLHVLSTDTQSQQVFGTYGGPYDHAYSVGAEGQAFGGAGQDTSKDEDTLAALANATYMAQALPAKEERQ